MVSISESLPGGFRLTETATGDRDVTMLLGAFVLIAAIAITAWAVTRL